MNYVLCRIQWGFKYTNYVGVDCYQQKTPNCASVGIKYKLWWYRLQSVVNTDSHSLWQWITLSSITNGQKVKSNIAVERNMTYAPVNCIDSTSNSIGGKLEILLALNDHDTNYCDQLFLNELICQSYFKHCVC